MIKSSHPLPLAARRTFRLALCTSLALGFGYGLAMPIPFIAPVFAALLTAAGKPPPGLKQLVGLVLFLGIALGLGVWLGPVLQLAPVSAILLIALGLFVSNRLAIVGGKVMPATLLALGLTVIPAASSVSPTLATALISSLIGGVIVAVLCQWLVYPLFPEERQQSPLPEPIPLGDGHWLALRATLVVLPAYLFTLTNPATYLPLTIKSILLGREASQTQVRDAAREMLGATALGGVAAILLWALLSLAVELWFFCGWVLLFALLFASGAYGLLKLRLSPGFWLNVLTNMLILLGAAVQDSFAGKDVYQAFALRISLFLLVSLYAVLVTTLLERLRPERRTFRSGNTEGKPC